MSRVPHPVASRLLWLAVVGLGLAVTLAQLGRWSWLFELFTHFPLQIALGLIITTLAALALRTWRAALVSTLLLVPPLLALSYYFPSGDDPDQPADLRVLTFNVLTSNSSHHQVCDFLLRSDADVILLLETDPPWLEALAPLEPGYPHILKEPREDNFGMALFSRHPIVSHRFQAIEGSGVPCLSVTLDLDGSRVNVIGGHPVPPVGAVNAVARNSYLDALATLAKDRQQPTIVMGDLNISAWSPFFRDLLAQGDLVDTGRRRGFQASWHRGRFPLALPIDHILHSGEFLCTGRSIGPDLGSDHRPVVADLAFRTR